MQALKISFNGIDRQYSNLREEILEATDRVLRSGWVMNGNNTAEFENWIAKRTDQTHAVSLHSGTTALEVQAEYYMQLALEDTNCPLVLLPSVTFPATANAFAKAGWNIEFADCDKNGRMVIPDDFRRFDLFVLVGIYGQSVETLFGRLWERGYNARVIEDGAQHWLCDQSTRYGESTAISFDPTKNLGNYGNGGALVTNDQQLADFARKFRNHGKGSGETITGSNARMSEVDCAQMLVKARYIDEWQARREKISRYWLEHFENTKIRSLIDKTNINGHCYHKFVVEVEDRDDVREKLGWRGIETRVHYATPLHEMNVFGNGGLDVLSNSSVLSRRVISLPIYPELTDLEVEYVAEQLLECV